MTEKTVPMKYRRMEFNAQLQTENDRLRAQRDALMEALKDAAEAFELASNGGGVDFYAYAQQFREDIAKAEENT